MAPSEGASGVGPAGAAKAAAAGRAAGDGPPPSVASITYWDELYEHRHAQWDTLYDYDDIRSVLSSFLPGGQAPGRRPPSVLHVGCGSSGVTEGLWKDGFRDICNIDFSEVIVRVMAERWEELAAQTADKGLESEADAMRRGVTWLQMDVSNLSRLDSGSFDLVLEKFTFDAMLCEAKDDASHGPACAAVRELHRVLAPEGVLLSVAWGEKRRPVLLRSGSLFEVDCQRLPGEAMQRPLAYFCRKRAPSVQPSAAVAAPEAATKCAAVGAGQAGAEEEACGLAAPATEPAAVASPPAAGTEPSAVATAPPASAPRPASTAGGAATSGGHAASGGQAGSSPDVHVETVEGWAEVRIGFGASVRPRDVELDISEDSVRWRLCTGAEAGSAAGATGDWHRARFPARVEVGTAVASWSRRGRRPAAEETTPGRMLVVRAPLIKDR